MCESYLQLYLKLVTLSTTSVSEQESRKRSSIGLRAVYHLRVFRVDLLLTRNFQVSRVKDLLSVLYFKTLSKYGQRMGGGTRFIREVWKTIFMDLVVK